MIHSYPSIYALGHRALADLLSDPVLVQEKVDGSQFSFGLFDEREGIQAAVYDPTALTLRCRSKGSELMIEAPEKMFSRAVAVVKELAPLLRIGYTYRGEYLVKPHHNALAYDRVPRNHVVIFDVNPGGVECYMDHDSAREEAERIGLEYVPVMHAGMLGSVEELRALLDRESFLGGQKVEGVVVKNYARFGPDKKVLMGKFVSEKFKEVHAKVWGESNPKQGDIVDRLAAKYGTQARWEKALIHLRERGLITDSPQDIATLIREVWPDIEKECADMIRDDLYTWAKDAIRRKATRGLPEWYKERLLEQQFNRAEA